MSVSLMLDKFDIFKSRGLFDDGKDVITVEDLVVLAVKFDLSAAVSADQHAVALPDFEGYVPAIVVGLAGAERHDHAFHGFFFGGIGNDDSALLAFILFLFDRCHENPIAHRSDFWCHSWLSFIVLIETVAGAV